MHDDQQYRPGERQHPKKTSLIPHHIHFPALLYPSSHGNVSSKTISGNAPKNSKSKVVPRFDFALCVCISTLLKNSQRIQRMKRIELRHKL